MAATQRLIRGATRTSRLTSTRLERKQPQSRTAWPGPYRWSAARSCGSSVHGVELASVLLLLPRSDADLGFAVLRDDLNLQALAGAQRDAEPRGGAAIANRGGGTHDQIRTAVGGRLQRGAETAPGDQLLKSLRGGSIRAAHVEGPLTTGTGRRGDSWHLRSRRGWGWCWQQAGDHGRHCRGSGRSWAG